MGPVADVRLVRDRAGTSKGFGYVEFRDLETVPSALLLNGQKFCSKHRVSAPSGSRCCCLCVLLAFLRVLCAGVTGPCFCSTSWLLACFRLRARLMIDST